MTAHGPVTIELSFDEVISAAMRASLASLVELVEQVPKIVDGPIRRLHAFVELACSNIDTLVALRARGATIFAQPSDGFLDAVAALGTVDVDGSPVRIEFRHGWPVLSMVSGNAIVTEAGSKSIAPGEGTPCSALKQGASA